MKIVTSQEMRRIENLGIHSPQDEIRMILAAGKSAADAILDWLPPMRRPPVFHLIAGTGKNGADTRICGAWLQKAGFQVCTYLPLGNPKSGPAADALAQSPVPLPTEFPSVFPSEGIILDGLLGTGLTNAPRENAATIIRKINASRLPVVAIDLPSGLNADTGEATDVVCADLTVTMGFPKRGMFLASGPNVCGKLRVVSFGLPEELMNQAMGEDAFGLQDARKLFRPRPRICHKNSFGKVLLLAGSKQYPGAAILATRGAMRAGAGVTTLCTPEELPAAMQLPAATILSHQIPSFADYQAILLGSGSDCTFVEQILPELLQMNLPVVLDATALRVLATKPQLLQAKITSPLFLTPHPGEMRPLLASFAPEAMDAPRREQAVALARKTGAIVVLKGCHTIVATPDGSSSLNLSGGPALATAGTGDVLAGMLTTLAAQYPPYDAARLAVFLHGYAADLYDGAQESFIADDLPELLPKAFSCIVRSKPS